MAKFVSIKLELFMNGEPPLNAYEDRWELLEPLPVLEPMPGPMLAPALELPEPLLALDAVDSE